MNEIPNNSLLAVSGGADSMYMLHKYRDIDGIHVAHVNYNIRHDSVQDAELVESICKMYNIPFHLHTETVPPNSGVEDWAREVRYLFFNEIMDKYNLTNIVTAHNANDQAETLLMKIHRGTGIRGLCGIHKYNKKFRAYRPLLHMKKDEIYYECRKYNIPYREDSTNVDTTYTRNWFRHEYVEDTMIDDLVKVADTISNLLPSLYKYAEDYYGDTIKYVDNKLYISKEINKSSLLFYYITEMLSDKVVISQGCFDRMFSPDPTTKRFNITTNVYCNKRKKHWIIIEGLL